MEGRTCTAKKLSITIPQVMMDINKTHNNKKLKGQRRPGILPKKQQENCSRVLASGRDNGESKLNGLEGLEQESRSNLTALAVCQ